jgi:hypothetical protein
LAHILVQNPHQKTLILAQDLENKGPKILLPPKIYDSKGVAFLKEFARHCRTDRSMSLDIDLLQRARARERET